MMMTTSMLKARTSALPAIAAALALSSTMAFAQQAQPVPTDPPPVTTPAPAVEAAPVTPDAVATVPEADTAAPVAKSTTTRTVKRSTRVATAKPAPGPTRPAPAKTVTTRTITHAAAPVAVAPAPSPAAPAAPPAPASQAKVTPLVDLNAKPAAPAQTTTATPAQGTDDALPIAAGGALALLALGGAAFAMSRRRKAHQEEWIEEQATEPAPAETAVATAPRHDPIVHEQEPAMIAPSAFAWGNEQPAEQQIESVPDDDRRPGESWVERAYRGPTPNNPSVSLKNRLRRAAFFDKREREVAAGVAEPVEMDAGLPDAMVEEQQRELA